MLTAEQLSLFREHSIQTRFEKFDREHPEVYEEIIRLTKLIRSRGFKHFAIGAMWERMRWYFVFERDQDDFKLNDHYRSRYVRKLIKDYPEFDGMFELRELRAR